MVFLSLLQRGLGPSELPLTVNVEEMSNGSPAGMRSGTLKKPSCGTGGPSGGHANAPVDTTASAAHRRRIRGFSTAARMETKRVMAGSFSLPRASERGGL